MAFGESRFRYRKIGLMTYRVYVKSVPDRGKGSGVGVGTVWRTRTGWSARRLDGTLATEDYPGSREVAAAALTRPAERCADCGDPLPPNLLCVPCLDRAEREAAPNG